MAKHNKNVSLPVIQRGVPMSSSQNRNMFDGISKRYDLLNKIISLGLDTYWRKKSIECLNIVPGGRYIDVGCGTGDVCLLLGRSGTRIQIFGVDPSYRMIKIAHRKTVETGCTDTIRYQIGDALQLPYGNERFNGSIMGFCIRNVTNRDRALKELFRVLQSGGTCVILELHVPGIRPFDSLYSIFSKYFIPFVAGVLSQKSAYRYLTDSISAFPSRGEFISIMEEAGFRQCRADSLFPDTVTVFSGKKP